MLTARERIQLFAIEIALMLVVGTVNMAIFLLSEFIIGCNLEFWLLCFSNFFVIFALRRRIYEKGS